MHGPNAGDQDARVQPRLSRRFNREFINTVLGDMDGDDLAEFERLLGIVRANLESALDSPPSPTTVAAAAHAASSRPAPKE